jgi:hypothetical protein
MHYVQNRVSKHVKEKLLELNGENEQTHTGVGCWNIYLSVVDRISR